jgi:hypothetical protein
MKSIKLYLNIIPLLIILFLIGSAGYFLFGEDLEIPFEDRQTRITRIEGFPQMLYVDEKRDKVREVITSEEELNEFLNKVDKEGRLNFNKNINFKRKYLIGTATKSLEGENHEFKIKKIYKDTEDKTLTIMQERIEPEDACKIGERENIWIDLIEIRKTDWKIEFELVQKTLPCDKEEE